MGRPRVKQAWVKEYSEGVIALSGGRQGDIGQALLNGREADAREALAEWQRCFPDRFYLELQRTGRAGEEDYLHAAVALATEFGCPVVATNDVRFLEADEFEAHEARVCIGDGRTLDDLCLVVGAVASNVSGFAAYVALPLLQRDSWRCALLRRVASLHSCHNARLAHS